MIEEEYANYDYQTTTVPLKTEYGATIGTEIKSSFKLCTKDCKYKNNWDALKSWLDEVLNEIKENDICDRMEYECTQIATLESVLAKVEEIESRK